MDEAQVKILGYIILSTLCLDLKIYKLNVQCKAGRICFLSLKEVRVSQLSRKEIRGNLIRVWKMTRGP